MSSDEQVIRVLLAKHGYNPDLPARGVTGPPGEVTDGWGSRGGVILGRLVRMKLRNHVCALDGVIIDGHSDPDRSGACIYCSKDMPLGEEASPCVPSRLSLAAVLCRCRPAPRTWSRLPAA